MTPRYLPRNSMLVKAHRQISVRSLGRSKSGPIAQREVDSLHARCGVYTQSDVVAGMLDSVGWQVSQNLSQLRLLEPAAGDGAFVVQAVQRLIASCRDRNVTICAQSLKDTI